MLWKRKKKVPADAHPKLLLKILNGINHLQYRAANYLSGKTKHWNKRVKLMFLGSIILVMGGSSGFVLLKTFQKSEPKAVLTTDQLSKPITIPMTPYTPHLENQFAENNIENLRRLIDSLRRDPAGRQLYEKLLHQRPGLVDSLNHLFEKSFPFHP